MFESIEEVEQQLTQKEILIINRIVESLDAARSEPALADFERRCNLRFQDCGVELAEASDDDDTSVGALVGGSILHVALFKPESLGYQPLLEKAGMPRILAKHAAHSILANARRTARESKRVRSVAQAIGFLSKRHRKIAHVRRRIGYLLGVWCSTTIIEDLFTTAGINESEFVELIQQPSIELDAIDRLKDIAQQVGPCLALQRGPKRRLPSIADELFRRRYRHLVRRSTTRRQKGLTGGIYGDQIEIATNVEFNLDGAFEAQSSRRRSRRAQPSNAT